MKKVLYISIIVIFILGLYPQVINAEEIEIVGEAAVLIEKNTGEVLFEKNKDERMYPASTTKIMTALIALEFGDLEEVVTVDSEIEWVPGDSSRADLYVGQRIKLAQLLYGLMLPSGNDAANSIAVHIGRRVNQGKELSLEEAFEAFVQLMNQKAQEIGAKNTNFMNPHGYHDENHYTTPIDLALITKKAMEHASFNDIIKATSYRYTFEDEMGNVQEGTWRSYNELLIEDSQHYYPYANGVKSGRTSMAGRCLVSSAIQEDFSIISVVLKSTEEDVWGDSKKVLSFGFDNYQYYTIGKNQSLAKVKVKNAHTDGDKEVNLITDKRIQFLIKKSDLSRMDTKYYLEENKEFDQQEDAIKAPIEKGQRIGRVVYLLNDEVLGEAELLAENEVLRKNLLSDYWWILLILIPLVLIIMRKRK